MAAVKAKKEDVIVTNPLELKKVEITIVGDTPLIMHRWSEKAKKEMRDAQTGKAKGKQKKPKNPVDDFIQSIYWKSGKPEYPEDADEETCMKAFEEAIASGNAKFCFPVTAIKQAGISAAYRLGWVKNQMGLRGAFRIEGDENNMVEIISDPPVMREDMVKVGMGTADLRYRGEFKNWKATFTVIYNASNADYSVETIINVLNAGGFTCGIGEWRPERDGDFGTFHVQQD